MKSKSAPSRPKAQIPSGSPVTVSVRIAIGRRAEQRLKIAAGSIRNAHGPVLPCSSAEAGCAGGSGADASRRHGWRHTLLDTRPLRVPPIGSFRRRRRGKPRASTPSPLGHHGSEGCRKVNVSAPIRSNFVCQASGSRQRRSSLFFWRAVHLSEMKEDLRFHELFDSLRARRS